MEAQDYSLAAHACQTKRSGFGLFFPDLDEGFNVLSLLIGALGSRKWMAARLGAAGGKSRSKPKRVAARASGAPRANRSPVKCGLIHRTPTPLHQGG
jgi:hypothetical protein